MADEAKKKPDENFSSPTKLNQVTKENAHLVDFDSLEVYLLCLAEDPESFEMISSYLVRRGWKVEIKSTVKETLRSIAIAKPDFVLVSVNLRHPKILQLPALIQNTMSIPAIAFAESTEAFAMQQMQQTTAEHKLQGFVSGPMVQRKVRQILQDMYDQGNITSPEWGSSLEQKKGSGASEAAKEKPQTMVFMSEKSRFEKDRSFKIVQSVGGKYGETAAIDRTDKDSKEHSAMQEGLHGKEFNLKQEAPQAKEYSITQEAPKSKQGSKKTKKKTAAEKAEPKISEALAANIRSRNPELKYSILETGPAAVRSPKVTSARRSTFEELIVTSLGSLMGETPQTEHTPIHFSQVGVLSAKCDEVEGLLLVGYQSDDTTQLLKSSFELKSAILAKAKEGGTKIKMSEPFTEASDDISDKLLALTEFRFQYHIKTEVGAVTVTFLEKKDVWGRSTEIGSTGMSEVPAEQIPGEEPLGFDLYLYLEKNQKFLKLAKRKGKLRASLRKKISEQARKLCVQNEQVSSFEKFVISRITKKIIDPN